MNRGTHKATTPSRAVNPGRKRENKILKKNSPLNFCDEFQAKQYHEHKYKGDHIMNTPNMEQFAKTVLGLPEDGQTAFYKMLEESEDLTPEDIETIKKCVSAYKLMTNTSLYKAAQTATGEALYEHFSSKA